MSQLTMLGGLHAETVAPYAVADILQTKPFGRVVITAIEENTNGQVFVCVSCVDGRTCIVLPREIEYRSR